MDPEGDGFVGTADLNLVLGYWNGTVPPVDSKIDYNGDGFIGQDDLNAVLSNWNMGVPPVGPLPEPTSGALLAVAGTLLLSRSRP